jgi:hypothetical protein
LQAALDKSSDGSSDIDLDLGTRADAGASSTTDVSNDPEPADNDNWDNHVPDADPMDVEMDMNHDDEDTHDTTDESSSVGSTDDAENTNLPKAVSETDSEEEEPEFNAITAEDLIHVLQERFGDEWQQQLHDLRE